MVEAENIDWETLNSKLPYHKNDEEYQKRSEIWDSIDVNGNGYLSLAEVDKGLRDALALDEIFDCKPAIMRAFQATKNSCKSKNTHGADYVERKEFRLLLLALRQYFEYYQAFARIDTSDDSRISKEEFMQGLDKIQEWVGEIENPEEEFDNIDSNDGG